MNYTLVSGLVRNFCYSINSKYIYPNTYRIRKLSSAESSEEGSGERKKSGFAEAFKRYTAAPEVTREENTFVSLLRNSKFIDLGDPQGKVVIGNILHVVGDDLYIDFGWKFNCVCPRPAKNGSEYVRGAKVRLRIKELELSTRFLGSSHDLTLLEADATLLGIVSSPARVQVKQQAT